MRLWDPANGQTLQVLSGHAGEVNCVSLSANGHRLASASDDKSVRIWDLQTGEPVSVLTGFGRPVRRVMLGPDGSFVVAAVANWSDKSAMTSVWSIPSGRKLLTLPDCFAVALSPDGQRLAVARWDSSVVLHELPSGRALKRLASHLDLVTSGGFSGDGTLLATGGFDWSVRLWNHADWNTQFVAPHESGLRSIALSSDGRLLATAADDACVRLWNTGEESPFGMFQVPAEQVWSVAIAPDDRTVAAGASDGTVRLWDAEAHRYERRLPLTTTSDVCLAFSPDGETLATAGDDSAVRLWNPRTGRLRATIPLAGNERVCRVVFFPRDVRMGVATSTGSIRILEDGTGNESLRLDAGGTVVSLSVSPDGRHVQSQTSEGTHRVWSLENDRAKLLLERHEPLSARTHQALAFSPDGRKVIRQSGPDLWFWNIDTTQERRFPTGSRSWLTCLAYAPGGKVFATGFETGRITLWSVGKHGSFQSQSTLLKHQRNVQSLAFSPNGRTLVSGSETGEIFVWNVASGQFLFPLRRQPGPVRQVAFSPDGRLLATSCEQPDGSGEVVLWNTIQGEPPTNLVRLRADSESLQTSENPLERSPRARTFIPPLRTPNES